ncbi:Hypothetical predicted protein, partial [Paramuricea clavata]
GIDKVVFIMTFNQVVSIARQIRNEVKGGILFVTFVHERKEDVYLLLGCTEPPKVYAFNLLSLRGSANSNNLDVVLHGLMQIFSDGSITKIVTDEHSKLSIIAHGFQLILKNRYELGEIWSFALDLKPIFESPSKFEAKDACHLFKQKRFELTSSPEDS